MQNTIYSNQHFSLFNLSLYEILSDDLKSLQPHFDNLISWVLKNSNKKLLKKFFFMIQSRIYKSVEHNDFIENYAHYKKLFYLDIEVDHIAEYCFCHIVHENDSYNNKHNVGITDVKFRLMYPNVRLLVFTIFMMYWRFTIYDVTHFNGNGKFGYENKILWHKYLEHVISNSTEYELKEADELFDKFNQFRDVNLAKKELSSRSYI